MLQRVHLRFEQFDVQDSNDCANDSVVVTDRHAGDVTYTMCGNDLPGDVTSSDNHLLVVFKTDGSVTRSGFFITYTARTIIPGMQHNYDYLTDNLVLVQNSSFAWLRY